jgi:hypothetical protein
VRRQHPVIPPVKEHQCSFEEGAKMRYLQQTPLHPARVALVCNEPVSCEQVIESILDPPQVQF